ncbi:sporulation protein YpjB [Pseudobacillus sp. FSL P4-0506]|uniref:sporulation protein YpjB n=1 Tax=unclassified Pseudobacillus TaxID=2619284 RepID=UPI0030F8AA8B
MKKIKCLFLICCLFIIPVHSQAEDADARLLRLDQIAGQALEFTKAGLYEDAEAQLKAVQLELIQLQFKDSGLPMEDWTVLSTALGEALHVINSPEGKETETLETVTTFRLVADAVVSRYRPLWTEMEQPVMSSLQSLKKSSMTADSSGFHESLNRFLANYYIIQPSLKVDVSEKSVRILDEHVRYMEQNGEKMLKEASAESEIEELEKAVEMVFKEMEKEDPAQPSLGWVISFTGGIIIVTLSYVGWKKYKGQKEEERKKQNH